MPFVKRNPPEWDELLRGQAMPRRGVHVTDCLGCPRRKRLVVEGAAIDLPKLEARLSGSILHHALAKVKPETAEIDVGGTLFGLDIVGSIDRIADGFTVTVDYKAGEGKGAGRTIPDAPYAEEVWQQETYRYLLEQAGNETTGWTIYYRWDKAWYAYDHTGPVWTEAALGDFRPHGGAYSAREIAHQCASETPAAALPLVGATQKIGKGTACDYCEVVGPCADATEIEL